MKSVEKYPEFQSDSKNIQFLTRKEHLEAHDGNWKKTTNWYYNPYYKKRVFLMKTLMFHVRLLI